jgi:hypothetical protein
MAKMALNDFLWDDCFAAFLAGHGEVGPKCVRLRIYSHES